MTPHNNAIKNILNISGIDFKNLPPCQSVLEKKIVRANTLAYMIKQATNNTINLPTEGWHTDEYGKIRIDYFDGDPFPENITDLALQSDDDDLDDLTDDSTSYEEDSEEESD